MPTTRIPVNNSLPETPNPRQPKTPNHATPASELVPRHPGSGTPTRDANETSRLTKRINNITETGNMTYDLRVHKLVMLMQRMQT